MVKPAFLSVQLSRLRVTFLCRDGISGLLDIVCALTLSTFTLFAVLQRELLDIPANERCACMVWSIEQCSCLRNPSPVFALTPIYVWPVVSIGFEQDRYKKIFLQNALSPHEIIIFGSGSMLGPAYPSIAAIHSCLRFLYVRTSHFLLYRSLSHGALLGGGAYWCILVSFDPNNLK